MVGESPSQIMQSSINAVTNRMKERTVGYIVEKVA
jgi:hypothetical protein